MKTLPRTIRISGLDEWIVRLSRELGLAMLVADLEGRVHVRAEILQDADIRPTRDPEISFQSVTGEKVKPVDAIRLLRAKIPMHRADYDRLAARYRLSAFFISRVESLELITRAQTLLVQALNQGTTLRDFIRQLNADFDAGGFTRLNSSHIRTVFQTNMMNAYQLGRFVQMRDADVVTVLPFWQYHTVGDTRVRDTHRAMAGFIARADDPVWNRWYPPNGFNCRCTVTAMGARQGADLGRETRQNINVPASGRMPHLDGVPVAPDKGFDNGPGKYFSDLLRNGKPQ